ncbi:hypothetical protein BDZ91DRAFT_779985 [Kalaharituber pfeilii]|nr:hypothetical protein BDZ91DRAFT_779985 [Kalaharituber pfeilii]
MQALKNLVQDLREVKAAAESHNLPRDDIQTIDGTKPKNPATGANSANPIATHIPPPPPRDLPRGWTARYDEKEKKYAYSKGVRGEEQWQVPDHVKKIPQLPPIHQHRIKTLKSKSDNNTQEQGPAPDAESKADPTTSAITESGSANEK